MRFSSFFCFFLIACGGATNEPSGPIAGGSSDTAGSTNAPAQSPGNTETPSASTPLNDCPQPAAVIAKSGTAIKQPTGSVQRFQLVYQGTDIGVTALRGVDMIIGGSDGPFAAGKNSGYWAEVRDASGKTTFSRLLQDPTRIEGPGANGGFVNADVEKCKAKLILVDVPRSPAGSVLVVFGSPYGTQGVAGELARFTLE